MLHSKRVFFATHIKSDIIEFDLLPILKSRLTHEKISWCNPKQMHITLKFIGETPLGQINEIENSFLTLLKNISPFEIQLSSLKMFGSKYKPSVLWVGIENDRLLKLIYNKIKLDFESKGFKSSRENFVPHLTIARIKEIKHLDSFQKVLSEYNSFKAESVKIDQFNLYESILDKNGAKHFVLKNYRLSENE